MKDRTRKKPKSYTKEEFRKKVLATQVNRRKMKETLDMVSGLNFDQYQEEVQEV